MIDEFFKELQGLVHVSNHMISPNGIVCLERISDRKRVHLCAHMEFGDMPVGMCEIWQNVDKVDGS